MNFESKEIDLTLNLTGRKNAEGKKENKSFETREPVCFDFADSIQGKLRAYQGVQQTLPEDQQDSAFLAYLKFLDMVYADLDITWIRKNFHGSEVKEMFNWVLAGLNGAKEDEES